MKIIPKKKESTSFRSKFVAFFSGSSSKVYEDIDDLGVKKTLDIKSMLVIIVAFVMTFEMMLGVYTVFPTFAKEVLVGVGATLFGVFLAFEISVVSPLNSPKIIIPRIIQALVFAFFVGTLAGCFFFKNDIKKHIDGQTLGRIDAVEAGFNAKIAAVQKQIDAEKNLVMALHDSANAQHQTAMAEGRGQLSGRAGKGLLFDQEMALYEQMKAKADRQEAASKPLIAVFEEDIAKIKVRKDRELREVKGAGTGLAETLLAYYEVTHKGPNMFLALVCYALTFFLVSLEVNHLMFSESTNEYKKLYLAHQQKMALDAKNQKASAARSKLAAEKQPAPAFEEEKHQTETEKARTEEKTEEPTGKTAQEPQPEAAPQNKQARYEAFKKQVDDTLKNVREKYAGSFFDRGVKNSLKDGYFKRYGKT